MSDFLLFGMALAMVAVLSALGLGLFSMVKGGEFNEKHGNKLMQARIILQLLALLCLVLAFITAR